MKVTWLKNHNVSGKPYRIPEKPPRGRSLPQRSDGGRRQGAVPSCPAERSGGAWRHGRCFRKVEVEPGEPVPDAFQKGKSRDQEHLYPAALHGAETVYRA